MLRGTATVLCGPWDKDFVGPKMMAHAGHATGLGSSLCLPGCIFTPSQRLGGRLAPREQRCDGVHSDGRAQEARPVVSARAACVELSTYSLEAPLNTLLLEKCVHEAVLHLDEAPCLHVVGSHIGAEFVRHAVPEPAVAAPQAWRGFAESVARDRADLLVLVHRVPDGPRPQTCWKLQMEAQVQASEHDGVQLWPPSSGLVAGKVGDCCDEDGDHGHRQDGEGSIFSRTGKRGAHSLHGPLQRDTAFWGLVIQSQRHAGLAGCYLLKTVRNRDATGCSCTHFSVTPVCKEVPLCEQYQTAWLV